MSEDLSLWKLGGLEVVHVVFGRPEARRNPSPRRRGRVVRGASLVLDAETCFLLVRSDL